ncbi:MAG: hypothetical protein GY756_11330, partial [bacterium]|nr:hypothetical protein [bacterium]
FLRMIDLKKRFYSFIDLKETGFPQNEVTEIYTAENHIYIGTLKGAVIRYNLDNKTFNIIKDGYNSLQNNSISDIILINGTLLIATYSGLYSYNPVTDKLKYHRSTFKDNRLKTMTVFENDVYLGTTGGQILKWNFDDFLLLGSINNIPINIISIIDDRVVIGTAGKGVFEYNLEKDLILPINIVNDQLSNKNITAISYFDESFWLGTFGEGIYVFDYSLNKISEHYKKRIILSSAQSEENIYFGTHHKGLFFYNK